MRRSGGINTSAAVLRPVAAAMVAAICLLAQASREDYRAAYRSWRQAEPALEFDAATAGDGLTPRTRHAAAEEAKYSAARNAFLNQLAGEYSIPALSLQTAPPLAQSSPAPSPELLRIVGAESSLLNTNIAAFAKDTDPTIRPLQQALDRERSALLALDSAIRDRQKAEDKATPTDSAMEQRRNSVIEQYQTMVGAITGSVDSVNREATEWAVYYQKLAEGARAAAPATVTSVSPTTVSPAAPNPAPAVEPAPHPASITPLPLPRYTGAWTYSTAGGLFHGAEPDFVDLVVHEDNGKATGTFYARFKLPPGSTGDPIVRFDFSGDFQAKRIQTFPLETSDGAKGSVDLIPGNAYNLLEINFQTETLPGKIHLGDLLLVKK